LSFKDKLGRLPKQLDRLPIDGVIDASGHWVDWKEKTGMPDNRYA
jgi:hypothetical protein